jgi:hypothetical protein
MYALDIAAELSYIQKQLIQLHLIQQGFANGRQLRQL